jgi:hypothetical protein
VKKTILLLSTLVFAACSNNNTNDEEKVISEETKQTLAQQYNLPAEPNKELNDSTINGIDANKNLIRDDWEREIVFTLHEEPLKIKLYNTLAANSTKLNNAFANKQTDDVNKLVKELQLIIGCGNQLFTYSFTDNLELLKMGENTKLRKDNALQIGNWLLKQNNNMFGPSKDEINEYCTAFKN